MITTTKHLVSIVALMLVVTLAFAAGNRLQGETILQFDQTFDIDPLGDGTFVMRMQFNASQFQEWQKRYGMNPSLLRREASRTLTQYEITDFKLEKNEMEREVTITMKAKGVTRYMGGGKVELDIPKEWRLVNQDGSQLKFTYLESLGNGVSAQNFITTNLPEGATDVSEPRQAGGGMNRVTYQVPVDGNSPAILILGIVLAAAGGGALGFGLVSRKSEAVTPAA